MKCKVKEKTGWSVNFMKQDDKYIYFKVYCKGEDYEWYGIKVKCPKDKFKTIEEMMK